jgi:CubicO group peptidase (beta-lactamase class C family)
MKKINFCLALLFSFLVCFAQQKQKRQSQQLDSIFSMLHAQHQFNGSVLIIEKGDVLLNKGYGYRDEVSKKPNDKNTIFELASCSKQFTAAAIVLLKRQGKLRYEDKLSKYIPELDFWNEITIYDLLRHTSGIPDFIFDMPETWDKTKIAGNEDVIKFYSVKRSMPEFTSGSRHSYSNTNYALLATIIERVSKKPYAVFLAENIFSPLNMKNTFVYNRRLAPRKLKNYATGYVWAKNSFTKVTAENPLYGRDGNVYFLDGIVGAGKINSSTLDIYKWLIALKENSLFTKAEFEEMTQVTTTTEGNIVPYGFGLDVSKREGTFAFGHTGRWDGYTSFIYYDVNKERIIITLQNFDFGTYPFDNIYQILNGQKLVTEYRKKILLKESELQRYTGNLYQRRWR